MNVWGGGKITGLPSRSPTASSHMATTMPSDSTHHITLTAPWVTRLVTAVDVHPAGVLWHLADSRLGPLWDRIGSYLPLPPVTYGIASFTAGRYFSTIRHASGSGRSRHRGDSRRGRSSPCPGTSSSCSSSAAPP